MATVSLQAATMASPEELKGPETKITGSDSSSDVPAGPTPRNAGKLDVLVQGVALFSDGYNIQVIGYMNSILAKL